MPKKTAASPTYRTKKILEAVAEPMNPIKIVQLGGLFSLSHAQEKHQSKGHTLAEM